jgi:hypothetical protein
MAEAYADGEERSARTDRWRAAWSATRDVFLWSRLTIWAIAAGALLLFDTDTVYPPDRPDNPALSTDLGLLTDVWARWDSVNFLDIATHGYDEDWASAFYPLYPSLVAAIGRLLGGHFVVAGVAVSLISCAIAFALLYRLSLIKLGDPRTARRSVVFLAIFPMSFFLQAVYSEALCLALLLAAFLAAEHTRFALAGTLAGLALLTRPVAAAAVLGLLVLAWSSRRRWQNVAWLMLVPILFSAFPLVLWQQLGDPWAFLHVERLWGRELSPFGPLGGLYDAVRASWAGALQLTVGSETDWYWTPEDPDRVAITNLMYSAYLGLFVILAVVAWRRLGPAYGVYAAASIALPLSNPENLTPLLSLPRFGLMVFPLFIALATLASRGRVETAVVATSAMLLGAETVRWALWQFVS